MFENNLYEKGQDHESPNRNLYPITTSLDESHRLTVGGCLLSNLAEIYGTPLYVLDEATLRKACSSYRASLNRHFPGESLPLYASKANSSLVISSLISSEGREALGIKRCTTPEDMREKNMV